MGDWCTIESDPGIFTELITALGVKGVQVEEVWDLDDLAKFETTYGIIFLFKYQNQEEKRAELSEGAPGVFFAKQMITNACATQAIISILMNRPELELGDVLSNYRSFTLQMTPDIRGLAISNSQEIQKIHNSFSRPEPFVMESRPASSDDDVYHFVAYVPVDGNIYELDGLRTGPILIGESGSEWTDNVKSAIRERMERYSKTETSFNVLALVKNIKQTCEVELKELKAEKARIQSGDPSAMDTSEEGSADTRLAQITGKISDLETKITQEDAKFAKWKSENIRRRHNYVPFVFNLLKTLANKGKLDGLIEQSKKADQSRPANQ